MSYLPRCAGGDQHLSAAFSHARISGQGRDHSADELGALAVRQIEPLGGREHGLCPDQSGIQREDADSMSPQFVCRVGRQLVGRRLGDAVDRVADVLLRRPEADVDHQSLAARHHQPRGVRAAHEGGSHAGVHHAGPALRGLLPEGHGPSERAVFHHALVAAPRRVDQEIQAAAAGGQPREDGGRLLVVQMIAGMSDD